MAPSSCRLSANTSLPLAAHAPGVAAEPAMHVLAHGRAAEDQHLDGEEARRRPQGRPRCGDRSARHRTGWSAAAARRAARRLPDRCRREWRPRRRAPGRSSRRPPMVTVSEVPSPSVTPMSSLSPPVSPPAVLSSTASGASLRLGLGKARTQRRRPDAGRPEPCARSRRWNARRSDPSDRGSHDARLQHPAPTRTCDRQTVR